MQQHSALTVLTEWLQSTGAANNFQTHVPYIIELDQHSNNRQTWNDDMQATLLVQQTHAQLASPATSESPVLLLSILLGVEDLVLTARTMWHGLKISLADLGLDPRHNRAHVFPRWPAGCTAVALPPD
jgi:hypothetical protein